MLFRKLSLLAQFSKPIDSRLDDNRNDLIDALIVLFSKFPSQSGARSIGARSFHNKKTAPTTLIVDAAWFLR